MSVTYESRLVSFFIYNPDLSEREGTVCVEHAGHTVMLASHVMS